MRKLDHPKDAENCGDEHLWGQQFKRLVNKLYCSLKNNFAWQTSSSHWMWSLFFFFLKKIGRLDHKDVKVAKNAKQFSRLPVLDDELNLLYLSASALVPGHLCFHSGPHPLGSRPEMTLLNQDRDLSFWPQPMFLTLTSPYQITFCEGLLLAFLFRDSILISQYSEFDLLPIILPL